MAQLPEYTELIEKHIALWLEGVSKGPLYDPVRYTMGGGGKRLRPALVLMVADMFNGSRTEAMPAALAVEVFHNFTLMHDDIMDNAPVRRGEPTVHEKWDTNTAILSGDATFALAYDQFSKLDPARAMAMFKVFNNAALIVCEGQEADMRFEGQEEVSVQEYIDMIGKKTAALLAAALQLGAMSANADERSVQAMHDLGMAMGIAFQLQDDLLDAYADPKELGKRKGGDILANKKTFLLLRAMELAKAQGSTRLAAAMQLSGAAKVQEVLAVFDAFHIKELTLEKMSEYYEKASALLDALPTAEASKTPLRVILDRLAVRVS